jgi:hypothetical protein
MRRRPCAASPSGCLRAWDSPGATLAQWQAGVPNRPQAPHPLVTGGVSLHWNFKLLLRLMPEVTVPLRTVAEEQQVAVRAPTRSNYSKPEQLSYFQEPGQVMLCSQVSCVLLKTEQIRRGLLRSGYRHTRLPSLRNPKPRAIPYF